MERARMSAITPASSLPVKQAIYTRVSWRILPLLILCYLFAYLDRINIGFAKLQMQADIGLSDAAFGLGAGIFFLGYMLFEIPSNLLLPKLGARKTLSRIMVLWGLTSMAMLFVHDVKLFYALRFLLGVFEAGFAPGMVFYLTCWYPQARMARVMAIVMAAAPLGGVIGAPLSTWVMSALAGSSGLAGWQWMFLIEGLPCVLLGAIVFLFLDDRIETARWLTNDEKSMLVAELGGHEGSHRGFRHVAADPRVYAMAFLLSHLRHLRGEFLATHNREVRRRFRFDDNRAAFQCPLCGCRLCHVHRGPKLRPSTGTPLAQRHSCGRGRMRAGHFGIHYRATLDVPDQHHPCNSHDVGRVYGLLGDATPVPQRKRCGGRHCAYQHSRVARRIYQSDRDRSGQNRHG